ncbi:MAG TPA: hypothetical protein ENK89_05940 [Desulfobulbaceae bacterium]|nr:hypothetical protein [Desulfobulbaceae bacterium]HHD64563.1 hypothetical protein [Desulfobulbaceae bacterium]
MDERKKQRRAIVRAMEYAVAENNLAEAADLLMRYRDDQIALDLLLEFYSYLPEAREDYIKELRTAARSRGVFLLAAVTNLSAYMYLISSEGVEFHGALNQQYLDQDLLNFFGYHTPDAFQSRCADVGKLPYYEPLQVDRDICPACHAVTGELHELGCPVEVCPWCGGQLIGCSCRFDRLGVEVIASEEELARLEILLNDQGRIAYSPDQRPGFADEGPGIMVGE